MPTLSDTVIVEGIRVKSTGWLVSPQELIDFIKNPDKQLSVAELKSSDPKISQLNSIPSDIADIAEHLNNFHNRILKSIRLMPHDFGMHDVETYGQWMLRTSLESSIEARYETFAGHSARYLSMTAVGFYNDIDRIIAEDPEYSMQIEELNKLYETCGCYNQHIDQTCRLLLPKIYQKLRQLRYTHYELTR